MFVLPQQLDWFFAAVVAGNFAGMKCFHFGVSLLKCEMTQWSVLSMFTGYILNGLVFWKLTTLPSDKSHTTKWISPSINLESKRTYKNTFCLDMYGVWCFKMQRTNTFILRLSFAGVKIFRKKAQVSIFSYWKMLSHFWLNSAQWTNNINEKRLAQFLHLII